MPETGPRGRKDKAARPQQLDDDRRRRYQQVSNLTDEQLQQTVGEYSVDRAAARARGLTDRDIDAAVAAIREMTEQTAIISAFYNQVALDTDQDARATVSDEDKAADKALLEQFFTEDYQLTDPVGHRDNRAMAIAVVMSGMIRKESYGRDGFAIADQQLVLHGDSAVTIASFEMNATQLARNLRTGEEQRRRRAGTFRQTNTFVLQKREWRLAATHLSQLPVEGASPEDADWMFLDDKVDG